MPTDPKLVQTESDVLRGLIASAAKQDAPAFAKLVADEVYMRGLGFNDPGCAKQFSGIVVLNAAQHPAFLRCLANVGVHVEPESRSPPSLAYEPDMKLAVEVRDGVVQEIVASSSSKAPPPSSAARAGADPHAGSHNVAPTATEAIRIAGKKEILPDPETQNAISVSGNNRRVGSFKLCINAHGTIKNVTMLSSTGSMAYDRKIERSIYGWRYRPFMVDGEPTPVCTAVTFIYTQQDGPNHRRPARR